MAAKPIPAQLAAACQAVRPAGPADAVAGVQPSYVAAPASTEEASAVLRAATTLDLTVVPRGTGARLHWGAPPQRCDLVIEMTTMDRVVEHAAGDLVATVQAGVSLERLAEVLGAAGQRLALDPPMLELPSASRPRSGADPSPGPGQRSTRGTVGGVLAAGAAGPLRLRYGSPRDLLIGITVVRADGTIARSGGKVVKNVAGYDLGKLFAGSRGTLGLITEATFRLHPLPAEAAYITVDCASAAEACHLLSAALDSPFAPVAADIDWPAAKARVQIGIGLEGGSAALAERVQALASLLARAAYHAHAAGGPAVSPNPPTWWGAGPAAQPDGTVLQIAYWPGDLGLVLAEIRGAAGAAGLDPAVGGAAGAGLLHTALPADADPDAVIAFVADLRAALGHVRPHSGHWTAALQHHPLAPGGHPAAVGHGGHPAPSGDDSHSAPSGHGGHQAPGGHAGHAPAGHAAPGGHGAHPATGTGQRPAADGRRPARGSAVVLHAPPGVAAVVDLFGPVPSLGLMRAVKAQFDPDRRMAPGRFAGGI